MSNTNQFSLVSAHLKEILKYLYELIQIDKEKRRTDSSGREFLEEARKGVHERFLDCSKMFCQQYKMLGC